MKLSPQVLALITALAWGIGGYFEKKGLHLGNLSPQVGITIRTGIALLILGTVSFSQWDTIAQAARSEPKAILMMAIGGGIIAGSVGMLSFYAAIKGADTLAQVMPIAFTSPLWSALMGVIIGGDKLNVQTIIGMVLTTTGIVVLTAGHQ